VINWSCSVAEQSPDERRIVLGTDGIDLKFAKTEKIPFPGHSSMHICTHVEHQFSWNWIMMPLNLLSTDARSLANKNLVKCQPHSHCASCPVVQKQPISVSHLCMTPLLWDNFSLVYNAQLFLFWPAWHSIMGAMMQRYTYWGTVRSLLQRLQAEATNSDTT
jgi:hypothetical protein